MRELPSLPDQFPSLTNGVFALREIVLSDAPDWLRYLSDDRVYEHTSTRLMSLSEVEDLIRILAERFRRKKQIRWALAEPNRGTMIGDLGYNTFWTRDQRAEIGYQLAPEYWRHGLMTDALLTIIDYGFSRLELNKVEATVNVDNPRSSGLLRKLGFQLEGTLRDHRNRRGVIGDSWQFGLLRRERIGGTTRPPA